MPAQLFEPSQQITVPTFTPVLSGLTTGSYAITDTIDFTRFMLPYGYFEFVATFASAPTTTADGIKIFQITSLDGTNFASGSASVVPPDDRLMASIDLIATTAAQRVHALRCEISPFKSKLVILNNSGRTLPADAALTLFATNTKG